MIQVTILKTHYDGHESTLMRRYSDEIQYENWCKNTWEQLETLNNEDE